MQCWPIYSCQPYRVDGCEFIVFLHPTAHFHWTWWLPICSVVILGGAYVPTLDSTDKYTEETGRLLPSFCFHSITFCVSAWRSWYAQSITQSVREVSTQQEPDWRTTNIDRWIRTEVRWPQSEGHCNGQLTCVASYIYIYMTISNVHWMWMEPLSWDCNFENTNLFSACNHKHIHDSFQ